MGRALIRQFTIVVIGFNRPTSLRRLLRTLATAAQYAGFAPALVISIDGGNDFGRQVSLAAAHEFAWPGEKRVIARDHHLGLRAHVLACGDLTQNLGDIVVFEDDLCVSPAALNFAAQALEKYADMPGIAGISLYAPTYNEFAEARFVPLDDGWDTYFAQTASSWGQIWTPRQWADFRAWLAQDIRETDIAIPEAVRNWPRASSWKRAFNLYLSDTKRYFVYPHTSFSTHMGDLGVHIRKDTTHLTSPLTIARKDYRFADLETSFTRYDPFFEIEPDSLKALAPALKNFDFDVDLTGAKSPAHLSKPYVLTSRSAALPPLRTYGFNHFPAELNVVFGEEGDAFGLRPRDGLSKRAPRAWSKRAKNFFVQ